VRDIIAESLQPFFTKIKINSYNVTAVLNSFPALADAIDLDIDVLRIETHNF
jgi:hypothetical protein